MNIPQFKSLPHTMLRSRYEALRSARSNYEGDNPEEEEGDARCDSEYLSRFAFFLQ